MRSVRAVRRNPRGVVNAALLPVGHMTPAHVAWPAAGPVRTAAGDSPFMPGAPCVPAQYQAKAWYQWACRRCGMADRPIKSPGATDPGRLALGGSGLAAVLLLGEEALELLGEFLAAWHGLARGGEQILVLGVERVILRL